MQFKYSIIPEPLKERENTMNELNDILEAVIMDIENLQGTLNVFEAAFRKAGAFSEMNPQDVAGACATIGGNLQKIHDETNKALEWATFAKYHREETEA